LAGENMKPQPGAWITSNIELVSPIAEGAMGAVWVAYHHRLTTQVAVKFVSDKLGDDTEEALARFEREAATAAQIKSPHVVQTFDSGLTDDGVPFMVMELLEGESLGDRLRRNSLLNLPEAAALLAQVARALTKAHALGIVHRDIKPDNLYLVRDQEGLFCKILDFGIAKQTRLPAMGGLTTEGKMVGTPEYLSPEQVLEGGRVDYRTDLWGLAVVIYVALTGHLPFSGRTLGQLCLALASCKHLPPSQLAGDLPRALDGWFLRALNRDSSQRFDNAKDLAISFAALIPDDDKAAMGIDVGGHTFLSISAPMLAIGAENTERQFGSSAASIPPPPNGRRSLSPALGAVAAIGLTALAVAGFIVMSTPSSGVAATATPTLGAAGEEAAEAVELPAPENVIDLDDQDAEDDGGGTPTPRSKVGSKYQPPATKTAAKPATKSAPPPPAEPPPPAAPPPANKPEDRRGEKELGF
jgi:eukaryotic-like serine/threonine-protein kinase